MALTTLKDRIRAATQKQDAPVTVPAVRVEGATPQELHDSAQAEGGAAADIVMTWLDQYQAHFTDALPAHVDTGAFLAAVRAALPDLARCRPASLLQALLTCARFGLLPDGRHAVIVAEGDRAVFVPMYQGYVDLMFRSGRVASVHVGLIYEADEWSYEPTAPAPLDFTHKPALTIPRAERGAPILAYAFCWMKSDARSQVVALTREDAEEIRDQYSAAYRRAESAGTTDSFWHTHFPEMWQKSAIRRLHKVVPMSAELIALETVDDAGESGAVQVTHAPEVVASGMAAEADAAHDQAEASQAEDAAGEAVGGTAARTWRRVQPKRTSRAQRKRRR